MPAVKTSQERLRDIVLSIDPFATFVVPDQSDRKQLYVGLVAATLGDSERGFAQHMGRSVYALHAIDAPERHNDMAIEVQYRGATVSIKIPDIGKGRG